MTSTPSWARPRESGHTPPVQAISVSTVPVGRGIPTRPTQLSPAPLVLDNRPVYDPAALPVDPGGVPEVPFTGGQPWDWPSVKRGERW